VSYILDALRKAERERQVTRVPTLATAHGGEPIRRHLWVWALAGGLVLSALVVYGFFWAWGRPDAVREAARPPVTAAGPSLSGARAAGGVSQPVERAPERDEPVSTLPTAPAIERAPGGRASARPRVAPPAAAAQAPRADLSAEDRRRTPPTAGPSDAPPARRAAAVQASPTPLPGRESAAEPRPTGDPAPQPPVTLEPGRSSDSGAGAVPRLTLDVLVYSDVPAERFVFINGRKYVEGQALDGDVLVEQITPDGAILRHQGKQLALRPKLNPYARPGSP